MTISQGVMFNAYPDSCGGSLAALIKLINAEDLRNIFSYFYILPSMFNSDLDRGFSIISYDLDNEIATKSDLDLLKSMGISLKLDLVLNHLSTQSPQFIDLVKNGNNSEYVDFFIDWNKFWDNRGLISSEGYIIPDKIYLDKLFMRKPGLPILKIPFPDGTFRFYWNTFYQQESYIIPSENELLNIEGITAENIDDIVNILKKAIASNELLDDVDFGENANLKELVVHYLEMNCVNFLGQMDINAESEKVWEFYSQAFEKLHDYGAKIVRLDAFAYLHKQVGLSNFFNEPGTWSYLEKIKKIADTYNITLLPEIHSKYQDNLHQKIADKGYPVYDFFFPGLLLNAIETSNGTILKAWINELLDKKITTINMLGSHDGIPVLDVKGMLSDFDIETLITTIQNRGGRVKDLYDSNGKKISYYQVNSTFFSALDENCKKFLLARVIQLFMPGIPQVWYLDLFAGTNDYQAADKMGHKEINRTNLSLKTIDKQLQKEVVKKQIKLISFRNNHPIFCNEANIDLVKSNSDEIRIEWKIPGSSVLLKSNLKNYSFQIVIDGDDKTEKIV